MQVLRGLPLASMQLAASIKEPLVEQGTAEVSNLKQASQHRLLSGCPPAECRYSETRPQSHCAAGRREDKELLAKGVCCDRHM